MPTPLIKEVEARLTLLFSGEDKELASELLTEQCSENVPGWRMAGIERMQLAVLKLSAGSIDKLLEAIALAHTDIRDLLMAVEFGEDIEAHKSWWP